MKLLVKKIQNEFDFNEYLKIIESFNEINPFYKIVGANLNELLEEKLQYFILLDEDETVLVLMPFLLRPIRHENNVYFDVTSPYGYSGPLFSSNLSRGYLFLFWKLVDQWYIEHNVVSEFIRFSINNNHLFYSGELRSTLSNVKGKIINEKDQWNNFKQKVRNNYRRSLSNNLKIEIVSQEIEDSKIELFHSIYTQTMARINASKQYFYSLNYFKGLINLSKGKSLIAFAYYQDKAISTELILISETTLFSYLGGTLSEYFYLRPNDFLKIEVIKWARENYMEYYILGGGKEDNDSLYHYKKSFFPNDEDAIYYTGRKIINEKMYNLLNSLFNIDTAIEKGASPYFPVYRKSN